MEHCNFCNQPQSAVQHLAVVGSAAICGECVEHAINLLRNQGFDLVEQHFQAWLRQRSQRYRVVHKDERVHCTFCTKSQDESEKVIAGPDVYICNECVGLCVEILEEEGIDLLADRIINIEHDSMIVRYFKLPPIQHHIGISLISYFATVLKYTHPDKAIKMRLELNGYEIKLIIDLPEGYKQAVQQLLDTYGLVIQGRSTPLQLLDSADLIEELETRLHTASVVFHSINGSDYESLGQDQKDTQEKFSQFLNGLGWILRREIESIDELYD